MRTLASVILAGSCTLVVACGDGAVGDDDDDSVGGDAAPAIDAAPEPDARPVFPPDDPGPADVRFDVHSGVEAHPISPFVYGHNQPEWDGRGARLTMGRSGGNRLTAYNWENNASNAGSDWYHQNDGYLGGGDTPGEVPRSAIAAAHARGAAQLVTVPIAGYVAADKLGDGDVADTPDYLDVRFDVSVPSKDGPLALTPELGDGVVYQDELVNFLETSFPDARTDPLRTIFYSLDNEPDLWSDTHARIHPAAVTYGELIQRNIDYAGAIKAVAPGALVFGFVSYGWNGYVSLQDAPDAAGRDFLDVYLAAMADAQTAAGMRLVDVLDLHWYPEARGGGQRITADDAGAEIAAARIQAPRSLWDPTYAEDSWIAEFSTLGPIALIPRLRDKIAAHYPGTELAFTEYYYGGGAHISGGLAQADVLGIFGREGVFAAALWPLGATDHAFIWGAFQLYRDFDGSGGAFGDTSIQATTSDVATSSVYASVDAGDGRRMVLVAINKAASETTAAIAVTHNRPFGTAAVYQLTASSPTPQPADDIDIVLTNAFVYTMPAMSASVLVLTAGDAGYSLP